MALIKCPECGKEISDSAEACPSCGRPIGSEKTPPQKKRSTLKIVAIILLVIFLSPVALFAGCVSCSLVGSTSTSAALKVGEPFRIDDVEYTILDIRYGTQGGTPYIGFDYSATNDSEKPKDFVALPGNLYSPDGNEVETTWVATLSDFLGGETKSNSLAPGASMEDVVGFHLVGDGEYTFIIDEFRFDGQLKFTVDNADGTDGAQPVITY